MGVKGLWSLLNPVSRPVQIESLEGKRMAIDSSIWLYQFQATMRDKDGRVLVNAHVLGFLRRINKLLFHGIKPVFVFDGGAPVLKRSTIAERKRKKAGAAANHARMAEKLFAAQMRREAVKVAQSSRDQEASRQEAEAAAAAARYNEDEGEQINEGAVYLEDLEGRPGPSRPRIEPTTSGSTSKRPLTPPPDPREERRKKFKKHDPYRLPEASMPTVSTEDKPDARLATEAELKQFIDEVHPEDIDIESPEFRALPTEVQYEIVGDMRVRSRQTSHKRLADMLRAAPTALDFSMAQIKNLSQRNALTQQLLTVTDMVGQAHLTIPVRIAAERNREYVLVKRDETQGGGWALGIREGSKQKPIEVEDKDEKPRRRRGDETDSESDSDIDDESDIEEIAPPPLQESRRTTDPDLREHRRREILEAIAARYAPKKAPRASLDIEGKAFGKARQPGAAPLFDTAEDDDEIPNEVVPSANDEALALALQQEELGSDEEEADLDLARALALSRKEAETDNHEGQSVISSPRSEAGESEDSFEEVSLDPSRVPTPQALSQQPTPIEIDQEDEDLVEVEGPLAPFTLPTSNKPRAEAAVPTNPPQPLVRNSLIPDATKGPSELPAPPATMARNGALDQSKEHHVVTDSADLAEVDRRLREEAIPAPPAPVPQSAPPRPVEADLAKEESDDDFVELLPGPTRKPSAPPSKPSSVQATAPIEEQKTSATRPIPSRAPPAPTSIATSDTKPRSPISTPQEVAKPHVVASRPSLHRSVSRLSSHRASPAVSRTSSVGSISRTPAREVEPDDPDNLTNSLLGIPATRPVDRHSYMEMAEESVPSSYHGSEYDGEDGDASDHDRDEDDEDDEDRIDWSRSASPVARPPLQPTQSGETIPSEVEDEDEDMAPAEMVAEQDDYARFMASIRNRDLNEVRTEIDDEIRILNNQNKVAMRDSDEITLAMVSQIQTLLRHYGIPYITAPMEAEAQCAKLAELGLVDGIITDDSDVFLFGGLQCFKNIFNDAKYAECFILSDIERELALSRERLISLAYLLGSDYTIGLPGVGPVVALELLSEFPGPQGIDHFKTWWTMVQRGQDTESETNTKWKKSFKKRFAATILITADWPNHLVREAYKYPTVDESEEPFHWGFPKLSALRSYLHEELSWSISKVDDELTPIVQRIARRGKVGALNKQATLDPFFDLSAGQGNYAPRRRTTANVSKRLLTVIKGFREAEARVVGGFDPDWELMMKDLDKEDPKGKGTGKRRKSESVVPPPGQDEVEDNVNGKEKSKAPRKPRRKKSESTIDTKEPDGQGETEGSSQPPKKRGRPRTNTASSASISEIGKESVPPLQPPDTEAGPSTAGGPEILVPKNGLRGSATGVVGAGKRKKAALTAWRNSTKSRDLGPS